MWIGEDWEKDGGGGESLGALVNTSLVKSKETLEALASHEINKI